MNRALPPGRIDPPPLPVVHGQGLATESVRHRSAPLPVGLVGELDPSTVGAFGLLGPDGRPRRVGWLDLDIGMLLDSEQVARRPEQSSPISRFPSSDIDLAFVVADRVPAGSVERTLREAGGDELESVSLFDVYRGPSVEDGSRSLAYRLRFCALDRTLTDEEIGRAPDGLHRCRGVGAPGHDCAEATTVGRRPPSGSRRPTEARPRSTPRPNYRRGTPSRPGLSLAGLGDTVAKPSRRIRGSSNVGVHQQEPATRGNDRAPGRVTRLVLMPSLIVVVVAIAGLVALHSASNSPFMDFVRAVVIIALVFYLLRLFFGYLAVRNAEYAVTDRRIVGKKGVVGTSICRHPGDADLAASKSSRGSSVASSGTGRSMSWRSGAHQNLDYLKKPLKFRGAIYERLENSRLLMGTAAYTLDVRSVSNGPPPAPAPAAVASPHHRPRSCPTGPPSRTGRCCAGVDRPCSGTGSCSCPTGAPSRTGRCCPGCRRPGPAPAAVAPASTRPAPAPAAVAPVSPPPLPHRHGVASVYRTCRPIPRRTGRPIRSVSRR